MSLDRWLIGALACWRLTSLLLREDGPFDVLMRLRTALGKVRGLAALAECLWCLSLWVAIPVTVVMLSDAWPVLIPFALSAVAIGMERYVNHDA